MSELRIKLLPGLAALLLLAFALPVRGQVLSPAEARLRARQAADQVQAAFNQAETALAQARKHYELLRVSGNEEALRLASEALQKAENSVFAAAAALETANTLAARCQEAEDPLKATALAAAVRAQAAAAAGTVSLVQANKAVIEATGAGNLAAARNALDIVGEAEAAAQTLDRQARESEQLAGLAAEAENEASVRAAVAAAQAQAAAAEINTLSLSRISVAVEKIAAGDSEAGEQLLAQARQTAEQALELSGTADQAAENARQSLAAADEEESNRAAAMSLALAAQTMQGANELMGEAVGLGYSPPGGERPASPI